MYEHYIIVDVRQIGASISETVVTFDILRSTVSRIYWEFLMEEIIAHREQPVPDHGSLLIVTRVIWLEMTAVADRRH